MSKQNRQLTQEEIAFKESNPSKRSRKVVAFICFILGLGVGVFFGSLIEVAVAHLNIPNIYIVLIYIAASALTGACFAVLYIPVLAFFVMLANTLERSVSKYSAKSIATGMFGLICGLLIAFLLCNIFNEIKIDWLKIMLSIFMYILLGITGLIIGFKRFSEISFLSDKKVGELSKNTNIKVLDTSALIDGRIVDLAKIGFIEGPFVVPQFVLSELRYIADNADLLKRNRGRRGLDIIKEMQKEKSINVIISDKEYEGDLDVDAKLLKLAQSMNAKIITNDFNLNKVAGVIDVQVLNINELSNAVKPVALPGEIMEVTIVKQGKDSEQGLAYMEDGTMIVIENGGNSIGQTVTVTVRTSLQTNAGRMIFTRI